MEIVFELSQRISDNFSWMDSLVIACFANCDVQINLFSRLYFYLRFSILSRVHFVADALNFQVYLSPWPQYKTYATMVLAEQAPLAEPVQDSSSSNGKSTFKEKLHHIGEKVRWSHFEFASVE